MRTKILSVPIPDRLGAMAGLVQSEDKLGRLQWREWLETPPSELGHVPGRRQAVQRGQKKTIR